MNLDELLRNFRSEDIAHALRASGLPTSGNKTQRLGRLLAANQGGEASETLAVFRTVDLHRVCEALGVDTGTHAGMVGGLARLTAGGDRQPSPAESTAPPAPRLLALKRLGIIAAIATLLYRVYRAVRRRR